MSKDKYSLLLTGAIVVDGQIRTSGSTVEVGKAEAENLLGRGLAELTAPEDLEEMPQTLEDLTAKLKSMTVPQLLAGVEEREIDLKGATKKDEIISRILEVHAAMMADD